MKRQSWSSLTPRQNYLLRLCWHLTSILLVVILSTGCAQLRFPGQQPEATLKMQVTPSSKGVYTITGETNLPDKTQMTVAAVRYLQLPNSAATRLNGDSVYAILDYRSVKISQGTWTTHLNLWEVAPNGRFQESWQLDQARLGLNLTPNDDVIFLATLAPVEELADIEQLLAKRGLKLQKELVRSTAEGKRYVQASQTLAIALPTERTTPPTPRPEDANGGWGERYLIPPESPNPLQLTPEPERLTTAPPTAEEFLR